MGRVRGDVLTRRAAAVALVAAVALATPVARAAPAPLRYALTGDAVAVALPSGGQVRVPLSALRPGADPASLALAARPATKAEERRYQAEQDAAYRAAAGPATAAGPRLAPDDEAAAYPGGAPLDPGTMTTVFGGNCDGYPALDATISPLRVAVDKHGTVFWVDRDLTVARHGSALIRRLDRTGRVRTIGSVVPPDTGRFDKSSTWWEFSVNVVPDDAGGVYVNTGWYRSDPYFPDEPASGYVLHYDARGTRTVVAGGGERIGVDEAGTRAASARDGRLAVQSWLGDVHALARDEHGLYLSEDPGPGLRNLVRFVNTGRDAVTFYAGTPQALVVQPGHIGTIAAQDDRDGGLTTVPGDAADANGEAHEYQYFKVADLAVRDQVLYTWDLTFYGIENGPPGTPTEDDKVEALNLGFDGAKRVVNAVGVAPGEVGVLAGSGNRKGGYAGDGGPARAAAFDVNWSGYNGGIAVAADGTLYIADTRNHRVRAVDGAGFIRTVAGNGTPGYDGEGAAATSRVWNPIGIDVDPSGAPVFAEPENARIRRLGADGTLRTVAGRGPYPCGDGRLATGRTAYGGAYLGRVPDVAADSKGNTYVADTSYNVIRRVNARGVVDLTIGRPTPCAGGRWRMPDPAACVEVGPRDGDGGPLSRVGLGDPRYLLVDAYDNLYVSDVDRVRYVNLLDTPVSVLGHVVPPRTVATLVDFQRRLVTVVSADLSGGRVTVYGPLGDLAVDRYGALYVADPNLGVIHRFGPCGDNGTIAGTSSPVVTEGQGDGGPAKSAAVSPAAGMTYDRDRDVLLFVDHPVNGAARVRAVNLSLSSLDVLGTRVAAQAIESVVGVGRCDRDYTGCSYGNGGDARDAGTTASGVEFDPTTRRLYLTESSDAVRVVLPDGRIAGLAAPVAESASPTVTWFGAKPIPVEGYAGDGGPASAAWLRLAHDDVAGHSGLAVTSRGDLVVADSARVRRILDADNAPLRLTSTIEAAVPAAGSAFTRPVQLHDALADAEGTYAPRLRLVPGLGWVVVASRGRGRGCDAWNVLDDRRATDVVWASGTTMPNAGGRTSSGASCGLGAAGSTLLVASARRVAAGRTSPVVEAGIEVATSADAASWSAEVSTLGAERIGSTEDLGEVAVGDDGKAALLAYRLPGRRFTVVRHAPGGAVVPVGSVDAGVAAFGSVVALRDGRVLVAFVELGPPAALGQRQDWVSVAEVGGGAPRVVRLARAAEDVHGAVVATPPSLSVAADGTVLLAYSDDRRITVAARSVPGAWRTRGHVATTGAVVLPSVVAGDAGRFGLAYYFAPRRGATAVHAKSADPWYAAVSTFGAPLSGDVVVRPLVASPQPVEIGPVCLSACTYTDAPYDAPLDSTSYPPPVRPRVLGPVAAGIDRHGVLRIAYTVGPRLSGNGNDNSVVATQRLCAHDRTSASAACGASFGAPLEEPDAVSPPPVPPVPPVGLVCSPRPPAFLHRARNVRRVASGAPDGAPAAAVLPPVAALLQPVLPVLQPPPPAPLVQVGTNVQGASVTQPQPVAQGQTGLSTGIATDEEKQAQVAEEYAFAALLAGAAALTAIAGCVARRRTRTATAPVDVS